MGHQGISSSEDRRKRILDAGAEAFALHGYARSEIKDIAKASGVTEADFYEYFASKKALYVELAQEIRDDLIARGGRAMAEANTLGARVEAAWDMFFQFVEDRPARAHVLTTTPLGVGELQAVMYAIQDEATRKLAQLLISEPSLLVGDDDREEKLHLYMEFIRCGMHGLARWWARHPEVPREKLTAAISTVAWHGLRDLQARPASPRGRL